MPRPLRQHRAGSEPDGSSRSRPRRERPHPHRDLVILQALLVVLAVVLGVTAPNGVAEAGAGGGTGGTTGDTIWSMTWWAGSPTGPGPDTGGPGGGVADCVWIDLGPSLGGVNDALVQSGLPPEFFDQPQGGGHPGIWGVDLWAEELLSKATPIDHFDLVACRDRSAVPPSGGYVESSLPEASPPGMGPRWLWIFWDTVPPLPGPTLPPVNERAYAETRLPVPTVETSPSSLGGIPAATVVNFPTWLWIDGGIWHEYVARSTVHGLVATIWAKPLDVAWRAGWSFPSPTDDPEGGVTYAPEVLVQTCDGPGTPYRLELAPTVQSSNCTFVFDQSTFGKREGLSASVEWEVHWAVSNEAGVVGDEGDLGVVASTGVRLIRVLQVESLISRA